MKHRNVALAAVVAFLCAASLARDGSAQVSAPQEAVFAQHCAVCHNDPATRAPSRATLGAMSPDLVVDALTNGAMKSQGSSLTGAERSALAEYLTGKKLGAVTAMAGRCAPNGHFAPSGPSWNGWGNGVENLRYQAATTLDAGNLKRLRLQWAFGFPGAVAAFGQPTVAGGRVFVGSQNRHVYALDATTGCWYWDFEAAAGVRTAVTIARAAGRNLAVFADKRAHAYAVDAATGALVWKTTVDAAAHGQVTGAPAVFAGRVYVPLSFGDDSAAADPLFACCKGRGSIVALDLTTGKQIWKTYTIPGPAVPQGKNARGVTRWGPSGVSTWSAPTIDAARGVLYAGTGDNHSAPATANSDAILAISLKDGALLWSRQLVRGDMGNAACYTAAKTNCPQPPGPDADFGASVNLVTLPNGKQLLIAGQKSGLVWALDPAARGNVVWRARVGRGGVLGGVQWGTAVARDTVFAAVSDIRFVAVVVGKPLVPNPASGGGLVALDVTNGRPRWSAPPVLACGERENCSPAQSAAVTATRSFVLSGSVDGHLRAYATATGRVVWDYNTARTFLTMNRVPASGGSIDSAGATVAGNAVYVGSGYGLYGGQPGNVLLAFRP